MQNLFEDLSKFRKNIKIITEYDEIKNLITDEWYMILSQENSSEKLNMLIDLWEKICGKELFQTINYLRKNMKDIYVLKTGDEYSIIYCIKMRNGEIDYYEGKFPVISEEKNNSKKIIEDFPTSIQLFYKVLHNGFYYYPSHAMGMLEIERVKCLNEDEWGIIDVLEKPLKIKMDTSFSFFSTGMGGYVVKDFSDNNSSQGIVWFANREPLYDRNFWNIIDEWIVLGFE